MRERLYRSMKEPIRQGLSWQETWQASDNGLICCWERGREERLKRPEEAARAERGELIVLPWKGGVRKKLKGEKMPGTLSYLAMWQGMRGEDLDIDPAGDQVVMCSRTGQAVLFTAVLPENAEEMWEGAGR